MTRKMTKDDIDDIVSDMSRTYIQDGPSSICLNAKREAKSLRAVREIKKAGFTSGADLKKITQKYKKLARAYASDFCTRAEGGTYIEGLRRRRAR